MKVLNHLSLEQQFRVRRVCRKWSELAPSSMTLDHQVLSVKKLVEKGLIQRTHSSRQQGEVFAGIVRNFMNVFRGFVVLQGNDRVPFTTLSVLSTEQRERVRGLLDFSSDSNLTCPPVRCYNNMSTFRGIRYLRFSSPYWTRQRFPTSLIALRLTCRSDFARMFRMLVRSGTIATLEHLFFSFLDSSDGFQALRDVEGAALRSVFIYRGSLAFEVLQPLLNLPAIELIAISQLGFIAFRNPVLRLRAEAAARNPRLRVVVYGREEFGREWADIVQPVLGLSSEMAENISGQPRGLGGGSL